jgi:hypothetical protein
MRLIALVICAMVAGCGHGQVAGVPLTVVPALCQEGTYFAANVAHQLRVDSYRLRQSEQLEAGAVCLFADGHAIVGIGSMGINRQQSDYLTGQPERYSRQGGFEIYGTQRIFGGPPKEGSGWWFTFEDTMRR